MKAQPTVSHSSQCITLFASDLTVSSVTSNPVHQQKLLSECQSHRDCQLPVNHLLFGKDPCPGTTKYLHVDYKCKPSEFSSLNLTCCYLSIVISLPTLLVSTSATDKNLTPCPHPNPPSLSPPPLYPFCSPPPLS